MNEQKLSSAPKAASSTNDDEDGNSVTLSMASSYDKGMLTLKQIFELQSLDAQSFLLDRLPSMTGEGVLDEPSYYESVVSTTTSLEDKKEEEGEEEGGESNNNNNNRPTTVHIEGIPETLTIKVPRLSDATKVVKNLREIDLCTKKVSLEWCKIEVVWHLRKTRRAARHPKVQCAAYDGRSSRYQFGKFAEDGPLAPFFVDVLSMEVTQKQLSSFASSSTGISSKSKCKKRRLRIFFYDEYAVEMGTWLKSNYHQGNRTTIISLHHIPGICIFPFPPDPEEKKGLIHYCLCIGGKNQIQVCENYLVPDGPVAYLRFDEAPCSMEPFQPSTLMEVRVTTWDSSKEMGRQSEGELVLSRLSFSRLSRLALAVQNERKQQQQQLLLLQDTATTAAAANATSSGVVAAATTSRGAKKRRASIPTSPTAKKKARISQTNAPQDPQANSTIKRRPQRQCQQKRQSQPKGRNFKSNQSPRKRYFLRQRVAKEFYREDIPESQEEVVFFGTVVKVIQMTFDNGKKDVFHIRYDDGDEEDMFLDEVEECIILYKFEKTSG